MIVATVVPVTAVVVSGTEADHTPSGTVIVAGTLTVGESLERLTTAPPAGAGPDRSTQAEPGVPPLTAIGAGRMSFSAVGNTVNWPEVETPLSVAVIVTGVGVVTWESGIAKSPQAKPARVTDAGTGATAGFELVRAMLEPAAGVADVS